MTELLCLGKLETKQQELACPQEEGAFVSLHLRRSQFSVLSWLLDKYSVHSSVTVPVVTPPTFTLHNQR